MKTSTNQSNVTHTPDGKFAKGNRLGKGNPHAAKVAKLRTALIKAVDADDLTAIIKKLVERAKAGDVIAAREILDRCLGKANQPLELTTDVELQKPMQIEVTFVKPIKQIES